MFFRPEDGWPKAISDGYVVCPAWNVCAFNGYRVHAFVLGDLLAVAGHRRLAMIFDARISFDEWITHIFDPTVDPTWEYDINDEYWNGHPADIIAYLTRTFEECDTVLAPFSDTQVAEGLLNLVQGFGYMHFLKETRVPLPDRLRCIGAMALLFEKCFAQRCTPESYLDSAGKIRFCHLNPLNGECCTWWASLPLHGLVHHAPHHPDAAELDRAILAVIRHCLEIDSLACQESGLIGLDEWSPYYEVTIEIIDDFLDRNPDIWRSCGNGPSE
jgi:hypothetical protein